MALKTCNCEYEASVFAKWIVYPLIGVTGVSVLHSVLHSAVRDVRGSAIITFKFSMAKF